MSEATPELRVLEELRKADRDRFLCALAAPAALRSDLGTLYAFNAELAGIADKVTEPMLGHIRLQWWRDALADIEAARAHRHHLVQAVAELAARRHLSSQKLHALIDARERDVEREQLDSLPALEAYAGDTSGALAELALDIALPDAAPAFRAAARRAGTAYGLVGLARATPHFARQGRVVLPGLDKDLALSLKGGPDVAHIVAHVADLAAEHLAALRQERLPRRAIAAFFPARLAAAQLEQLRRHGYDPFATGSVAPSGLHIWRLLLARWLGRI
ncbi:squalene/phytoene synthase family protein [Dongia sp.]|uniref:squalene/phytoene synthase family protein n=1 Tax=Dongia sp. TaxID=1977262 RepID=UPI0035B14A20